jgi:hypothetical protein
MANTIKVKRGTDANRTGITPAEGELLYTTDTKKVYVGDGTTAGGNEVGGGGGSQTPAELLADIKTVDGAGSGLDADLLDGVQGSGYVNTSSAQFVGGSKTFNSETKFGSSYVDPDSGVARDAKFGTNGIAVSGGIKTDTLNGGTPWTSANDGSGSGLDADLLDGQQGSYYAAASSLSNYTPLDHIRSLGVRAFTNGTDPNITTAQVIAEIESDGGFDSYTSAFKTSWSYAGNYNLTDAGRFTETAGTAWLTWTDNSSDTTRGNITALAIAPNTGGSAGRVFIYNDQGSSYSPGWREVWTSTSDGSGSGLDADLLDGQQGSYYQPASTALTTSTSHGGDVTGTYNNLQIAANVVNANELNVSGNGTSGQFLRSDGDGSFNWYTLPSYLTGNQTITLSGDLTGSGTTSINAQIAANVVGANELNVSGNGTAGQVLQSDGDGSMTWATPSSGGGITTGKAIAMAMVFG